MVQGSLFVVMGVSGTGKSTIGKLLEKKLGLPFFDGDQFHSEANISKMLAGIPLTDTDRQGWLLSINKLLQSQKNVGAIVACSALKKSYRKLLLRGVENELQFIFLEGSFEEVASRLKGRKGHFMPASLLQSQFDTLEVPTDAIAVSISDTPHHIVESILNLIAWK